MLYVLILIGKAYHIISRLEDVGGEINAYTTKEETCVYGSFMKEELNKVQDLKLQANQSFLIHFGPDQ